MHFSGNINAHRVLVFCFIIIPLLQNAKLRFFDCHGPYILKMFGVLFCSSTISIKIMFFINNTGQWRRKVPKRVCVWGGGGGGHIFFTVILRQTYGKGPLR